MRIVICLIILSFFGSCQKEKANLNEPTDTSLSGINTYARARSVLDNLAVMSETPCLPEISSDDYYIAADSTSFISPLEYCAYIWKDKFEYPLLYGDWFKPSEQIYYANSVMVSLPEIAKSCTIYQLNELKGTCFFIKAYATYNAVLEFANLYGPTAGSDQGVPIRNSNDPEIPSKPFTVKDTYDSIITYLTAAISLLPEQVEPKRKNRPSKVAVYALLARIYLSMSDYGNANKYADSCLKKYAVLIDYNKIDTSSYSPFSISNEEVLYQSNLLSDVTVFYLNEFSVDSILLNSYDDADLRRNLYFSITNSGRAKVRASYTGNDMRFSGLATDEIYLIRAETFARLGNKEAAMKDLNTLLRNRKKTGSFTELTAIDNEDALNKILPERRKSLVYRGLRWTDIRRLNNENRGINLKRVVNGKEYTLKAGSIRFILPFPSDVIFSNGYIKQNLR